MRSAEERPDTSQIEHALCSLENAELGIRGIGLQILEGNADHPELLGHALVALCSTIKSGIEILQAGVTEGGDDGEHS